MLSNCGAGEDSWESLSCKEIKLVNLKGNQPWISIGRTDAEAEAPILWPPDAKKWLSGKGPDAGKDWRKEEKGTTEDEMVGWHRWLNGHEFEKTLEDGDGQESLACCSPWGQKESDMTEQLKDNNNVSGCDLGRKAMTNLKSRGISLLTKVCIAKAMIFLVVMYGCES